MIALGIDLIEVDRIRRSIQSAHFCERVFGAQERQQLAARSMAAESAAACFAAKEAFGKALGCGVRGFSLAEVQLLREPSGRPYLSLCGRALLLAEERAVKFGGRVPHTKEYPAPFGGGKKKTYRRRLPQREAGVFPAREQKGWIPHDETFGLCTVPPPGGACRAGRR